MMENKTLQAVFTAALAGLSYYFGIIAIPVTVLIIAMTIDYITGLISAWHNKELSSKKGIFGIVKKICYLFAVAAAMGVDWLIYCGLSQVGVTIGYSIIFGLLVTIWLIINELISILENLSKIGVPLPKFLISIIKKLKVTTENTANTNESEENNNE